MPRRRPGPLIAFGLANLLLGAFLLLCSGCGLIKPTVTVNNVDVTAQLQDHLAREIPGYTALSLLISIGGILLAVGFVVSGIGLFLVQGWGRIVALACAGLAIIHQIGMAVFYLAFYNPAMTRFFTQQRQMDFSFMLKAGTWMSVILAVFIVLYSLLLFVGLLTGSTARAFRGDGGDEPDEEDYDRPRPRPRASDEGEYDEPPRRPAPRRRPRDEDEDDRPPPRRAPRRGD